MALIPKVSDAGEAARHSILLARNGIDPRKEREQKAKADEAEAQAQAFTFGKLADDYIERYVRRNTRASSTHQTARLLRRAAEYFGLKPVREIRESRCDRVHRADPVPG
jgi:hypothetical protein